MELGTVILWIIVTFICGYIVGWKYYEKLLDEDIEAFEEHQNSLKYIDNETQEIHDAEIVVNITIEKHDKFYLVYNLDTNDFMAQGKNRKEVEAALVDRYPNKLFNATEENLAELGFK
jgi:hypothetical protein